MSTLGRLEPVDLRAVWAREAGDFTPWLAREENLSLLSDTIGIPLVFEAQEKDVGPFRADILCKEADSEHWVLIENQVEKTDHTHLGQILTYAAGLQAVTVVWVAKTFTDEHRAALDWLNEMTVEGINFFGLEIELWRIGDSPVAPKFNVVCKPNDWTKRGLAPVGTGRDSELKQLQLEFWTGFSAYLEQRGFKEARVPKPYKQNWMPFSVGRTGFFVGAIASTYDSEKNTWDCGELRMEFVISPQDAEACYGILKSNEPEIQAAMGEPLTWYEAENVRARRVYVRRSAQLTDRTQWPEYFEWLHPRLVKFLQVFKPWVANLDRAATGGGGTV